MLCCLGCVVRARQGVNQFPLYPLVHGFYHHHVCWAHIKAVHEHLCVVSFALELQRGEAGARTVGRGFRQCQYIPVKGWTPVEGEMRVNEKVLYMLCFSSIPGEGGDSCGKQE